MLGEWNRTALVAVCLLAAAACGEQYVERFAGGQAPGLLPSGAACEDHQGCAGGLCLDFGDGAGATCAAICAGECPEGRVCKRADGRDPQAPSICVPPSSKLCLACEFDDDCGDFGDLCLTVDGASFCGLDCSESDSCPAGFVCSGIRNTDGVEVSRQCLPSSGTCSCTEATAGQARACEKHTPGLGTCSGEEVCQTTGAWSVCDAPTPIVELCDGRDNDCDGLVDEDPTGAPLSRPCGYGPEPRRAECRGVELCHRGIWSPCSLPAPVTEEIRCDGFDEDCNGEVDDGLLHTADHCSECGDSCAPGPGYDDSTQRSCSSEADGWTCAPIACLAPYYDANDDSADGCELADDHRVEGDAVLLNDAWSRAAPVGDESLACSDGTEIISCDLRLPSDDRVHIPPLADGPPTDFLRFYAEDTVLFPACEPETWVCVLFWQRPAGSLSGEMEVCASEVLDAENTAPTFPENRCKTINLEWETWTAMELPNDDGGWFYLRVRNTRGEFWGEYSVAAYDHDTEGGAEACPLGLPGDPCFYDP